MTLRNRNGDQNNLVQLETNSRQLYDCLLCEPPVEGLGEDSLWHHAHEQHGDLDVSNMNQVRILFHRRPRREELEVYWLAANGHLVDKIIELWQTSPRSVLIMRLISPSV